MDPPRGRRSLGRGQWQRQTEGPHRKSGLAVGAQPLEIPPLQGTWWRDLTWDACISHLSVIGGCGCGGWGRSRAARQRRGVVRPAMEPDHAGEEAARRPSRSSTHRGAGQRGQAMGGAAGVLGRAHTGAGGGAWWRGLGGGWAGRGGLGMAGWRGVRGWPVRWRPGNGRAARGLGMGGAARGLGMAGAVAAWGWAGGAGAGYGRRGGGLGWEAWGKKVDE